MDRYVVVEDEKECRVVVVIVIVNVYEFVWDKDGNVGLEEIVMD